MALARPRILFVHSGYRWSSFKQIDLTLLRSMYPTRECFYPGDRRRFPLLVAGIAWADVAFVWFADQHSWYTTRLCKLLRRKCLIVAGGYDVAFVPEIGYGLMTLGPSRRLFAERSLAACDRVVAFSQSAASEVRRNFAVDDSRLSVVYLGVDSGRYRPAPGGEKRDLVVTVAAVRSENLRRKGLQTFVEAARYAPEYRFALVGELFDREAVDLLLRMAPSNVELTGWLSEEQLIHIYGDAKVYVQVSRHEGFGMALAEAMACECVPVVTRVGSIPEVVADAGIYVPLDNPQATARGIREAARMPLGAAARRRIRELFPLEKRREGLRAIVDRLLDP